MPDWSNLASEEVLLILQRGAGAEWDDAASGFLDTHQFSDLLMHADVAVAGGHPASQFRRAGIGTAPPVTVWGCSRGHLPEGLNSVRAIRQAWRAGGQAGWELGDIVLGTDSCWLAACPKSPVRGLIPALEELTSSELPTVPLERLTAASLRADAVIASLFKVSRGEAQTAIEYGFVFRNFRPLTQRTTQLKPGDELVYRTKGRIELTDVEENSRSGRNWVSFQRYPC